MKIPLSVAICTYNRDKSLDKCLYSLTKQTLNLFEVIIIDGGSTDSTNQVIEKYQSKLKIKLVVFKDKELSKVRDLGWRKASGKLVAWIDDDVVASPNWAKEIVNVFDNPKIGGVSGPTIVPDKLLANRDVFFFYNPKTRLQKILAQFWNYFFLEGKMFSPGRLMPSGAWTPGSNFKQILKLKEPCEVDYLEACNMTLRRDLIKKVNGFDYSFTGVAEWCELDLAIRIKKLGFKLIFDPKVKVNHNISQTGVYKRRTHSKQRMENFFKFYFRHIYKPEIKYIFKLFTYVLFLNGYWVFKAIKTNNINWLGGLIGTFTGLKRVSVFKDVRPELFLITEFLMMNFYYQIDQFIFLASKKYNQPQLKILDVGSHVSPYKKYFNQAQFSTLDIKQTKENPVDFVADLNQKITSIKNNSFDCVICTQVIEHLTNPQMAFKEFKRILKPDGRLFLTTNFFYQIHMEPNDYFRFTKYGLKHLARLSGFKIKQITAQGGIFSTIAYLLTTMPVRIIFKKNNIFYRLYLIISAPITIFLNLSALLLDKLDKDKKVTINYQAIFEK